MADDGLLAMGGIGILAVGALAVALLRDGGQRVINIPEGFGSGSSSGGSDAEPDPEPTYPDVGGSGGSSGEWTYEDPSENPENNDEELEFGDNDPGPPDPSDVLAGDTDWSSGSTAGGTGGTPTQEWRF